MTPALVGKAQRMYDARQFTMAEIAASCGVTPMTIYRNIRTGQPTATEITNSPPEAIGNNQDHR
jgi:predicted DNA-binding transcriptional regulator YafY